MIASYTTKVAKSFFSADTSGVRLRESSRQRSCLNIYLLQKHAAFIFIMDGAHYCYCAHFLRMPR